ncbi:MAG: ATP-binding protein [Marinisporobacter sp.]|nr:ATP-binding protein [Marinisporobacter sp.]
MKRIPIGISDFKEMISGNYYYIDKSLFIKEIVEDGSKVILLPRPRRFGKTLNMSMLKNFHEKSKEDTRDLFKNLKINKYKEIMKLQGKYPVIYITFKDVKYSKWEDCKEALESLVKDAFMKHRYLLEENFLEENERLIFKSILERKAKSVDFMSGLKLLSEYLHRYHKEKTVILIDEYDVPIQSGYIYGYYEKIIEFMRIFFSSGLKDNAYLEKGVLTGILRVAKESIFSGLNNLEVCTILNDRYSDHFGFSENEVEEMLKYYNLEFEMDEIKKWYNGYIFGEKVIYNPWSILNYTKNFKSGFKAYWVNTSSNDLVKKVLTKANDTVKRELEDLIKGKSIRKQINEDIVMNEIDKGAENVWSFLLFSGYLKVVHEELIMGRTYCNLKIPNIEVVYLYEEIILSWFKGSINTDKFHILLKSLITGDIETFEEILSEYLIKSASYFDIDESEKFYHAFVLGILVALSDTYEVRSNRESGYGRYDIMMIPKNKEDLGIVIEFKKVRKRRKETLELAVENALKQIVEKNYKQELLDLGVKNILEMGVAFEGKEVLVGKI